MFSKTKLCKFNSGIPCSRGDACAFAHTPEELRPLPDLRLTKMCRAYRLHGFCGKANSCNFAHSEEDLRAQHAHAQAIEELNKEPNEPLNMAVASYLSKRPSRAGDLDEMHTSMYLEEAPELVAAKVAKPAMTNKDIFSRQTSAQTTAGTTSTGFSRQSSTAQWEEAIGMWSRQTSDDFEFKAVNAFKMQEERSWQGTTQSFVEGQASRIIDSHGNDASSVASCEGELELHVQNTFLAALPRRRSGPRASSMPARGRSYTGSTQRSQFFSL